MSRKIAYEKPFHHFGDESATFLNFNALLFAAP